MLISNLFQISNVWKKLDQPDQMSDHLKLDRSVRRLYLSTHTNHIPYHPCIVKVPTFTIKNERNVGKNTIDPRGISRIYQALAYFKGPKSSQIIRTRTNQKGFPNPQDVCQALIGKIMHTTSLISNQFLWKAAWWGLFRRWKVAVRCLRLIMVPWCSMYMEYV